MKLKRLREILSSMRLAIPNQWWIVCCLSIGQVGYCTPEAIAEILKVWNLPRRSVGYGGLKDRHATTTQTITLFKGPQRGMQQRGFELTYLGQASREFHAKDIEGNRFEITLRDMTDAQALNGLDLLPAVACRGPQLLRRPALWIAGRKRSVRGPTRGERETYERALYLALRTPIHTTAAREARSRFSRDHWQTG